MGKLCAFTRNSSGRRPGVHRTTVALVLVALIAAACSSDDGPAESSASTSTTITTTTAPPDEEPAAEEPAEEELVALALGEASLTFDELDQLFSEAPSFLPDRVEAATPWLIAQAGRQYLSAAGMPISEEQLAASRIVVAADGTDPDTAWGAVQVDSHALSEGLRELSLQRAADAIEASGELPEAVCSSHILVESSEEAEVARQRVLDGEAFADVARELSTGPSGPSGGDLGCELTSRFVVEYSDAARETGVGLSEPVLSDFGWHVIEVRSIGPATLEVHPEADQAFVDSAIRNATGALAQTIWQEQLTELFDLIADDAFVHPEVGVWNQLTTRVVAP